MLRAASGGAANGPERWPRAAALVGSLATFTSSPGENVLGNDTTTEQAGGAFAT